MYNMKQVCDQLDITYEHLRFYCNEGLIPNLKRDKNNHRIFNEKNVLWLKGLLALRKCGMSIKDMKHYMHLCIEGKSTINERKDMLKKQNNLLLHKIKELENSLLYIHNKQDYYDDILLGKIEYTSNLVSSDN